MSKNTLNSICITLFLFYTLKCTFLSSHVYCNVINKTKPISETKLKTCCEYQNSFSLLGECHSPQTEYLTNFRTLYNLSGIAHKLVP